MTTLGGYYLDPHVTQFDGSTYAGENCTPTSGANGANAATGGRIALDGAQVRHLIARSDETDPSTPGWSIPDLDHAMAKIGVPFENASGQGWAAAVASLNAGHYIALQGDSDQFFNSTCSGAFNGDHCVGVHPARRTVNGLRQQWIDDPICQQGRWEYEHVLHDYAAKYNAGIRFGLFTDKVPAAPAPAPAPGGNNVAVRYCQIKTTAKRMSLTKGQPIYEKPGGQHVTSMSKAADVLEVGLAGSVAGKAWRAVVIGTRWSYADGQAHSTMLYVPASAGKVIPA